MSVKLLERIGFRTLILNAGYYRSNNRSVELSSLDCSTNGNGAGYPLIKYINFWESLVVCGDIVQHLRSIMQDSP